MVLAENDGGRVESRPAAIGRGFSATPERIAKLQSQVEALERQPSGELSKSFSSVLGEKPAAPQSRKVQFRDQRKAALPKRGPRPTLGQLGLKSRLWAEEDSKEPEDIIIKG